MNSQQLHSDSGAPGPAQSVTLLAVFAHPDDESYLCGGTLAHYAAAGLRVSLVCATLGEAGDIADPALAARTTLPTVRNGELRAAAGLLGLADVQLLGYPDGTLAAVPFPEGAERVALCLQTIQPDVVISFGPEGVYGHPDHVAVHRWTKEAMTIYCGDGADSRQRPPFPRLYYVAPPRSWYRAVSERTRLRGAPDRYGPRLDVLGVPDELVTARVSVGAAAAARIVAIRAHRSQLFADHPFATLPEADLRELFAVEHFTRSWPPVAESESPEVGLGMPRAS
jgi:LmbE family N-acetylglucosaminyl deacetylase